MRAGGMCWCMFRTARRCSTHSPHSCGLLHEQMWHFIPVMRLFGRNGFDWTHHEGGPVCIRSVLGCQSGVHVLRLKWTVVTSDCDDGGTDVCSRTEMRSGVLSRCHVQTMFSSQLYN